jgi:hypothetical protein
MGSPLARILKLGLGFAALVSMTGAADPASAQVTLPQYSSDLHLGVRECAGGPCHGSATPVGLRVRENEHTIWLREDRHAQSYKTLLTERSQAIAQNMGLPQPAHQSDLCLDCHSNNAKRRAEDFRIEDGVGCEACHGGSRRWLKSHSSQTRTHQQNVADGLYPTDDPVRRAELCTSCHLGNQDKYVGHRMLGAGHPRLRFELDSYQETQPPHFSVDDDYRERGKQITEPVRLWAIGQAVLVRELARWIADPKRNKDGIWPEFAVLDCYTCHHSMEEKRRPSGRMRGLQTDPGTPRLNDSAFLMLRHIMVPIDTEASARLTRDARELHAAISKSVGDREVLAARMANYVDQLIPQIANWRISAEGVRQIAVSLIDEGIDNQYNDYPSAEQAAGAIQSLAATLNRLQPYAQDRLDLVNQAIENVLQVTRDGDRFQTRSPQFTETLRRLRELLTA